MVVEPGQGIEAARDYMQPQQRRHVSARGSYKAGHVVNPVTLAEMDRIVQIWADACLQLRDRDLKVCSGWSPRRTSCRTPPCRPPNKTAVDELRNCDARSRAIFFSPEGARAGNR